MSKSVSASSSENSPPTSFEQFNELVKGIESLYVLGRRLSDASLGNLARLPTAWVHHRPSEIISVIGLSGSMRHRRYNRTGSRLEYCALCLRYTERKVCRWSSLPSPCPASTANPEH